MRKWNENEALSVLTSQGAVIENKVITLRDGIIGLKGLTACSALDYLCNYCGYISNLPSPNK